MTTLDFNHKAIKNIPRYTCGIYSIHNKLTNDRCVGSSTDIRSRVTAHLISVTRNNNSRANKNLLSAVRKYGIDKFEIEILETCEDNKSTISFLECKYIRELGTYNCVRVDGRKVKRFDLDGNFIKEYTNIKSAAKDVNIQPDNIYQCCLMKKKTAVRKSMWRFSDECPFSKIECYKKYCPVGGRIGHKIVQFDKAGNFIRVFDKIYEAAKLLNADLATIHRCCKDNKNSFNRTAYGYKWKFYEDYLKECANGN